MTVHMLTISLVILPIYITMLSLFKMFGHDNIREARFYMPIGYYCILFVLWYAVMPFVYFVEDLRDEKYRHYL